MQIFASPNLPTCQSNLCTCNYYSRATVSCFVLYADPLQSAPEITDLLNLIAARAMQWKWKVVGLQLKISLQLLNSIDEKYKQTVLCYAEMFQVWKNNGDSPFTWGTIIDALKAPIVGEAQLATELQESLCKQWMHSQFVVDFFCLWFWTF